MPRQKRASSQGSSTSLAGMGTLGHPSGMMMTGTLRGHSPLPPAPTSKPPTPPMARAMGSGTLSKGSREYRTPPAVAPPQVPSNYAANYPLGHSRRSERNSSSGYGTLPMPHASSQHQSPYNNPAQLMMMQQHPPQVGMVHPQQQGHYHHQQPSPLPSSVYAPGLERQRSYSNPPPPSPGTMMNAGGHMEHQQMPLPPPSNYGSAAEAVSGGRVRSMSPPPPPMPMIDDQDSLGGGRRRVVPVDADLPGWVPKDYIDKGN